METQVRRIIPNTREQQLVSGVYLALAISLHVRPDVGTLLPYVESTTILNPYSIAAIYFFCSGYLFRAVNIMLWKYAMAILPLLVTCMYLFLYMIGNPASSLVTGVLCFGFAILLLSDLQQQAVRRG
jgi:hypothetical protein